MIDSEWISSGAMKRINQRKQHQIKLKYQLDFDIIFLCILLFFSSSVQRESLIVPDLIECAAPIFFEITAY